MLRSRLRAPSAATVIALIALFVALSGTAVAVAPTVVNIADPNTPTHVAKVGAGGALSVSGSTSMLAQAKPFNFVAISFTDGFITAQIQPTAATVALTGIRVANATANPTTVSLYEYASDGVSCAVASPQRFLGQFSVPAVQTVDEALTTPIVLKPLTGQPNWCLASYASGTSGAGFYITYNGYVVSGTFATSSAANAAKPGATPHRSPS